MNVYAAAVRLYPRAFREEYGEDLVDLAEQMRLHLGRPRADLRLAGDLLVSLPAQYLEVLVKRPGRLLLPTLSAGIAAVLSAMAVVAGARAGIGFLLLALVAAALAARAFPQVRIVRERAWSRHWWRLLVAGAGLNLSVAAGQVFFDNDSELLWPLAFGGVLGGWLLLGAGVALGVLHVARRRPQASRTV